MERLGGWCWYLTDKAGLLERHRCGKWMYFFKDQAFAMSICEKAITENVCYECKCTDMEVTGADSGVICFYLNGDDVDNHRRVIKFMLDNGLIQKTKTGKLYNISFKFDDQTRAGEYSKFRRDNQACPIHRFEHRKMDKLKLSILIIGGAVAYLAIEPLVRPATLGLYYPLPACRHSTTNESPVISL